MLRNRFNDASPNAQSSMSCWVRTPGPAQELDKHNSAALPKRQFRSAATGGARLRPGRGRTTCVTPRPVRAPTIARPRARQRAQATTAPLRKTTPHRPAHRRSGPACRDRRSREENIDRTGWGTLTTDGRLNSRSGDVPVNDVLATSMVAATGKCASSRGEGGAPGRESTAGSHDLTSGRSTVPARQAVAEEDPGLVVPTARTAILGTSIAAKTSRRTGTATTPPPIPSRPASRPINTLRPHPDDRRIGRQQIVHVNSVQVVLHGRKRASKLAGQCKRAFRGFGWRDEGRNISARWRCRRSTASTSGRLAGSCRRTSRASCRRCGPSSSRAASPTRPTA